MPADWTTARVTTIFKKGDPALTENYRPICLTAVAYKVCATMVKQRLLDAGLDARLWKSQFSFRKGRCTGDAIYVAGRHVELALAQRGGTASLLALDWQKAFDSINVDSLLDGLRRFGFPPKILRVINSLMQDRKFYVEDSGVKSNQR